MAIQHGKMRRMAASSNGAVGVDEYLSRLGERVRHARLRHGMTRRMLARDSGISERYLAELEAGRGNLSIALLRRLAAAIDVSISDLVDESDPPVEYTLLVERIRRLSADERAAASRMLAARFGDGAERLSRVALIGLRGAGKSTLGAVLAQHLSWPMVEMSREIETETGLNVAEIFDLWGQAAYRRYERRALERILRTRTRIVLCTGGGIVSEPVTFERLLDACFTVWIQASPQEHWNRVIGQGDRRVESSGDSEALTDMRRILSQRDALYGKADARLDTAGKTVKQSARELVALVEKAISP
jgi:XRE family transcriptional regulator, aerobic/anaerobic benzoate catabolism transcriptional regulator